MNVVICASTERHAARSVGFFVPIVDLQPPDSIGTGKTRSCKRHFANLVPEFGARSANLRTARSISNLLCRAIMLFGERRLLLEHNAEWRLLHSELIPHEVRTGAVQPEQNLPPAFQLVHDYIA